MVLCTTYIRTWYQLVISRLPRYVPGICRYVCARVGYVLCATYVRKLVRARLFVPGISRLPRYVYVDTYVPVAELIFRSMILLYYSNTIKSSTEKQSSAIIVHEPKRTATSTRAIHTRQNKPFEAAAVQQRRCPQLSYSLAV